MDTARHFAAVGIATLALCMGVGTAHAGTGPFTAAGPYPSQPYCDKARQIQAKSGWEVGPNCFFDDYNGQGWYFMQRPA